MLNSKTNGLAKNVMLNMYINATGVKATDKLPNALSYISQSASKGEFDPETGIWNIGELAVNETVTLEIISEAVKAGKFTNTVTVSSNEDDYNTANNEAGATVEITDSDDDNQVDENHADDNQDEEDDAITINKEMQKSTSKTDSHATGNPILPVLLALVSMCVAARRKL